MKKYAAMAAASIDEQRALMDEIDAINQSHSVEIEAMRDQIGNLSELNDKFVSVTLDRASTWVQQFDENFVHFFESQSQLAITFGKKIDQLHARFQRVGDALRSAGEVQKMRAQIEQFEAEKKQFTAMIEQVEAQINEMSADRESLLKQLEEKNGGTSEEVASKMEEMARQLQEKTQALAAKEEEVESLVSMNDILVGRIEELEQGSEVQGSAVEMEREIKRLRQQLDKVTTEYCALELSHEQAIDERMKALIREKDAEIEYLRQQVGSGTDDDSLERIESLSHKLDEKDAEIDALEEQLEAAAHFEKENEELKAEVEAKDEQLRELQEQLSKMTTLEHADELERELEIEREKAQKSDKKAEKLAIQVEQMQSQLEEKIEEVSELHENLEEVMRKLEDDEKVHNSLRLEKEAVANELLQAKTMLQKERTGKQDLQAKCEEMERKYKNLQALNEALEARINENAENEREELMNQISEIEEHNEKLLIRASDADLLEEKVKELEEEIKQCKTMIDTYKKIGETVQAQLDEAREQNHCLCEQIKLYHPPSPAKKCSISCSPIKAETTDTDHEQEVAGLRNKVTEQEKAFDELSRAVQDARQVASQREGELKLLHAKLTELIQTNKSYEKAMAEQKTVATQLESRVKEITTKYEQEIQANRDLSLRLKEISSDLALVREKYTEEQNGREQFVNQLRSMLSGTSTESSIISAVSSFTQRHVEAREVTNVRDIAARIAQLAGHHISQMDSIATTVQSKCGLVVSAASRIERTVQLGQRREMSRFSGMTSPFSTERKPLSVLKKPNENKEAHTLHDFSKISRVVFAPRDRPANYESMTPRARKPVFV